MGISTSIKNLCLTAMFGAVVVAAAGFAGLSPAKAASPAETACFNNVQGKIAWNYSNNKNWAANNIQNLCAGTINWQQPGKCFNTVMFGGINWGSSTTWQWQNALNLCKGSNNANNTVNCFKNKINNGQAWPQAIAACNHNPGLQQPGGGGYGPGGGLNPLPPQASAEAQCYEKVQGKIAWNYSNNKNWAEVNVKNLCAGTQHPAQPGKCFERVMFGGVNWGSSTTWQWQNALNLCKGTENANNRVNCFQNKIGNGVPWPQAIDQCN